MAQINFASNLFCATARITTSNNDATGGGTLTNLISNAAANGFIYGWRVMAVTTTVVSCVRFWRTTGGTTRLLIPAVAVTAQTITNAGPAFSLEMGYPEEQMLMLPIIAGDTISATMAIDTGSQTLDIMMWGAFQ